MIKEFFNRNNPKVNIEFKTRHEEPLIDKCCLCNEEKECKERNFFEYNLDLRIGAKRWTSTSRLVCFLCDEALEIKQKKKELKRLKKVENLKKLKINKWLKERKRLIGK